MALFLHFSPSYRHLEFIGGVSVAKVLMDIESSYRHLELVYSRFVLYLIYSHRVMDIVGYDSVLK